MAENLYHAGLRLKKFIDKSGFTITDIVTKTGIARSSLYDMFGKKELLFSRVEPILTVLAIDAETWTGYKSIVSEPASPYGLQALVDSLTRENELLRLQVENLNKELLSLKQKPKRK